MVSAEESMRGRKWRRQQKRKYQKPLRNKEAQKVREANQRYEDMLEQERHELFIAEVAESNGHLSKTTRRMVDWQQPETVS